MSTSNAINQPASQPDDARAQSGAKRPYHKPEVRYEQVFETTALSCGKVQTTQGSCASNRSAS